MTGTKEVGFDLWETLSSVNKKAGNTTKAAIVEVLDTVLSNKGAAAAFGTVMLANGAAAMYKNNHGSYPSSTNKYTSLIDSILVTTQNQVRSIMPPAMTSIMEKALVVPNIAGIPISSPKVETNKEVEVSESMVIVQSAATKKYWTDNAVPRLKEWTVNGYLTTASPLDSGLQIKPSLAWQAYYLEVCADSRRPVLFKTNRGEFVKVQITNLHTIEEASYNNGIEVQISLKEYNPYFISDHTGDNEIATLVSTRG